MIFKNYTERLIDENVITIETCNYNKTDIWFLERIENYGRKGYLINIDFKKEEGD